MDKRKIWEKYLPGPSERFYSVDYSINLDKSFDIQQECLSENSYLQAHDYIDELGVSYIIGYMDYMYNNMVDDGLAHIFNECYDEIKEELEKINEHDTALAVIKNTDKTFMFFSLGVEIESRDDFFIKDEKAWMSEKVKIIKDAINVTTNDYNVKIKEMVEEAYYGGELRIYFTGHFSDFIKPNDSSIKSIHFSENVTIAIANSGNGSGDFTTLPISVSLPFKRENLFVDRAVRYSFCYDVCGLGHDAFDDTKVRLGYDVINKKIPTSETNEYLEKEDQYNIEFKNGGCTFGDRYMKRHRDVRYTNKPVCGWICPHCDMFWID